MSAPNPNTPDNFIEIAAAEGKSYAWKSVIIETVSSLAKLKGAKDTAQFLYQLADSLAVVGIPEGGKRDDV